MPKKSVISKEMKQELDESQSKVLRFKWLAAGCQTWDEIITNIRQCIAFIEELRMKNGQIIRNTSDYLYYQLPNKKVN